MRQGFAHHPPGERAEYLEKAIHHYEQALEVYTRQAFPEDWADTHYKLGNAYREHTSSTRTTSTPSA